MRENFSTEIKCMVSPGIYAIYCASNDGFYIGSSLDRRGRTTCHLNSLRRGGHKNPHLQNAWAKYREPAFECVYLQDVPSDKLLQIEQIYLDWNFRRNGVCFNIDRIARPVPSFFGRKHSPETKTKISRAALGVPKTKEHVENILKAKAAKRMVSP